MEANTSHISFDQGFVMELALQEDIGAELDDFLLLKLLGIHDEARDSVQMILWRHLRYFPVFAEVADYVIEKDDPLLKRRLLETIVFESIHFSHPDEKLFMETIRELLNAGHTYDSDFVLGSTIFFKHFDNSVLVRNKPSNHLHVAKLDISILPFTISDCSFRCH